VRVCILTAAWRRFDVTRLALAQRESLGVELAARGIRMRSLVVADDENLDIAAEYGCDTLEIPNWPLGAKCNAGLLAAAEDADYVVWIGSDDWIHPDAFDPLLVMQNPDRLPIHVGSVVAVVDLIGGRMRRIRSSSPYGAPPWIIDARLIRATQRRHERPIKPLLKRGLDGALVRGLRLNRLPFEFISFDPHDFRCVDFKSDVNLTPYGGVTKHLGFGEEHDPWGALRDWYPADLVTRAQALHETMR
jgi:hypothetical protein